MFTLPENATFLERLLRYPADPRVDNWPCMSTPLWPLMTVSAYLYVVLWWGPRYMQARQAYSLKTFIYFYNAFQVIANAYMFYMVLTSGWTTTYTLGCQPPDRSNSKESMRMARAMWSWLMMKKLELVETVLYVLRKKDRQVSFLHVYHHISTFLITWIAARFSPEGSITFGVMPNALVHVMMYSYFLLSAVDNAGIKKMLSVVKKYLTAIQLVQLTIIAVHASQGFSSSCHAGPKLLLYSMLPNVVVLIYLFSDFFRTNYRRKTKYSNYVDGEKVE